MLSQRARTVKSTANADLLSCTLHILTLETEPKFNAFVQWAKIEEICLTEQEKKWKAAPEVIKLQSE